jgi:AraC family transcriptional regulator of adaptative response / DNA-3-methyladenine glycosylase II
MQPTNQLSEDLCYRAVRTPYDWNSLIAFLAPRAIPGVEQVTPDSYRRSVLVDGTPHGIEVTFEPEPPRLVLRVQPPVARGPIEVVERIKALFDADADPMPIGDHLRRDAGLTRLVRARPGLRVPGAWDGFELGVRAILGQQISVAGATTLAGRLAQAFGARTSDETCGATRLFPTAERLAEADLAKIGLPGARARALRAFSREVAEGRLSLSSAAPIEETRARLLAIPGVGPWTVEYVALRALRDPDAFPAGDLGLRRALSVEGALVSEKELRARSEAWRPWRAYAAMHLWASLSSATSRRKHARLS